MAAATLLVLVADFEPSVGIESAGRPGEVALTPGRSLWENRDRKTGKKRTFEVCPETLKVPIPVKKAVPTASVGALGFVFEKR